MAKPKPILDEKNVYDTKMYFVRLFNNVEDGSFYKSDIFVKDLSYEAKFALEEINKNYKATEEEELEAMKTWLAMYITEKGWRRCINSLTQKKHRDKGKKNCNNRKRHIDVPADAWSSLHRLAEKAGTTKTDMLVTLITAAEQQSLNKITP